MGWIAKLNPENVRGDLGTDRLNVHLIYLPNSEGRIRLIAEGVGDVEYNDAVRPLEEAKSDFTLLSDVLRIGEAGLYMLDATNGKRTLTIAKIPERIIHVEGDRGTVVRTECLPLDLTKVCVDPNYEPRFDILLVNWRKDGLRVYVDSPLGCGHFNEEPFPDRAAAEAEFKRVSDAVKRGYILEVHPDRRVRLRLVGE